MTSDGYQAQKESTTSRIYIYVSPKYVPADHLRQVAENSATTGRRRETDMRHSVVLGDDLDVAAEANALLGGYLGPVHIDVQARV